MARARVLAVDDDPSILTMLQRALELENLDFSSATTPAEARKVIVDWAPDVILLDIMLAGEDGIELLTEFRRDLDIPVILVSGKGSEMDRVLGLRMGADDYVVKPFSYPELVARIGVAIRRSTPRREESRRREFGSLAIDLVAREVFIRGALIDTTAKEFDLLEFLSGSPRQVFTRDQLLQQVWESSSEWQDVATVTEHIRRLRHKIESTEGEQHIVTVRGVGYRFEP